MSQIYHLDAGGDIRRLLLGPGEGLQPLDLDIPLSAVSVGAQGEGQVEVTFRQGIPGGLPPDDISGVTCLVLNQYTQVVAVLSDFPFVSDEDFLSEKGQRRVAVPKGGQRRAGVHQIQGDFRQWEQGVHGQIHLRRLLRGLLADIPGQPGTKGRDRFCGTEAAAA